MARQNSRDKLIRSGLRSLEQEGIDVGSPSVSMIGALQAHFGNDRATDLAVVHLMGKVADTTSVEALDGLTAKASDKEVKREIRRSLFKLSQRGLAVPEKARPDAASSPNFSLAPEIESFLSSVDGGGNYLLLLTRPQMGGGLMVIQAVVNDRQGLKTIGGNVIRRKMLRDMMHEMKAEHGMSMVAIPWEYGAWRLHAAYEQARSAGVEGIDDYPALRSRLTTAEVKPQPHPVFDHFPEQTLDAVQLDGTAKLLDEPEFNTWVIDEELLAPYLEDARALRDSRILLNPVQKEERLRSIIQRAMEGIFLDEAMRPVFERRLQDLALHFVLSEREAKARSLLGVAQALARKELGGLMGIPLLEALVRRSFGLYLEREQKKPDEPSLIIKP